MEIINHFFGASVGVWLAYIFLEKKEKSYSLKYAITVLFLATITIILLALTFNLLTRLEIF
jgi:uncharacterized membrane protein YsdA (DUF1294 family)